VYFLNIKKIGYLTKETFTGFDDTKEKLDGMIIEGRNCKDNIFFKMEIDI
jgi:hypothetical protein